MNLVSGRQFRHRAFAPQRLQSQSALNAAPWFLRFDMSVRLVLGDQQTSDRSFRHCPIFGG